MSAPGACSNCGAGLAGRYCHDCGQDTVPPETAMASWRTQVDRLRRTLHALVLRPGLLTREHLSGGRVRFIPPLTLFLNVVAVFFLFSAVTQFQLSAFARSDTSHHIERSIERRAERAGIDKAVFMERAERRFQGVYTLCLATISLAGYTLLFRLLFLRQWKGWRGAFTLTLHYLAFVFLVFPVFLASAATVSHAGWGAAGRAVGFVTTGAIAVTWLAGAARRLFGESWPWAIGKGVAIVAVGFVLDNLMFVTAMIVTLSIA